MSKHGNSTLWLYWSRLANTHSRAGVARHGEVSLSEETPFEPERRAMSVNGPQPVNTQLNPESRFAVRVKSKDGDEIIWIEPSKSRIIGTFEFNEGMDGFVDILSEGSAGQVLVDAIIFEKLNK